MAKLLFSLAAIALCCCNPKVSSKLLITDSKPLLVNKDFVQFEIDDETDLSKYKKIGEFEVRDQGFTIKCDEYTVRELLKKEVLAVGGNAMKIIELREPNQWSTCARIKVYGYFIEDLWKYQDEIIWSKERRLTSQDFKASPENRPTPSRSVCSIDWVVERSKYRYMVEFKCKTIFNPTKSFLCSDFNVDSLVRQEQTHFDITELYARKLIQSLRDKNINTSREMDYYFVEVLNEIESEREIMQDLYESDLMDSPTNQSVWELRIQKELEEQSHLETKLQLIRKR